MIRFYCILLFLPILVACNDKLKEKEPEQASIPVTGTWQLVSGYTIQNGDTSIAEYGKNERMIKIINNTHFAFFRHDLNKGKDTSSASFTSGGGTYSLKGNQYTEHLEFCNFREWENNTFQFILTINNDTLTQQGIEKVENLGINREVIEKYIRVKQ